MGCTQSKSTTNVVLKENNHKNKPNEKAVKQSPPAPAVVEETEEATASCTAATEGNDQVPDNKETEKELPEKQPVLMPTAVVGIEMAEHPNKSLTTNCTSSSFTIPMTIVEGVASMKSNNAVGSIGPMSKSKTKIPENDNVVDKVPSQVGLSPKSPRRSRRRSNSSGVKEMSLADLATVEDWKELNMLTMDSFLQPEVPPGNNNNNKDDAFMSLKPAVELAHMDNIPTAIAFGTSGNNKDNEKPSAEATQPNTNNESSCLEPREVSAARPVVLKDTIAITKTANQDAEPVEATVVHSNNTKPCEPAETRQGDDAAQENKKDAVPPVVEQNTCAACKSAEDNPGEFKFCANCKAVSYCGKECQKKHWKEHKKVCGNNSVVGGTSSSGSSLIQESSLSSSSSISETGSNTLSSSAENNEGVEIAAEENEAEQMSNVHEDAVKELEECLARLRSEDLDVDEAGVKEEAKKELDTKLSSLETEISNSLGRDLDAVEVARKEGELASSPTATVDENVAPRASINEPRMCAGCKKVEKVVGAFKSCAKCRDVYYCNRTCQKSHWKEHKKSCCKADSKRSLVESKNASLKQILAY